MSSTITEIFKNETSNGSSPIFTASPYDNQLNIVQGLQVLGVQDGAAINIQQFDASESDESDSANWSNMTLENSLTVGMFFPIATSPSELKFRVNLSGVGASTDITINLISEQK